MFTNPEQFAYATKTLFDLQVQTFDALANKAMRGVEQVVALNLSTAKNSMEGALSMGKELSQAKDVHGALSAVSSSMQPGLAGANAYGTQLKQILDDIGREFREAGDTHMGEAKNTLSALIHDVTQNVKPGSENAVEIIKTAIDNAFSGYEKVATATRAAVRTVEEQVAKATELVAPGMGTAAAKDAQQPAETQ